MLDPFAGSGTTGIICKKRGRRAWLSDREPKSPHIRCHDLIVDGLPEVPWGEVKLSYLDPPYGNQTKNQYSRDPTDLANLPIDGYAPAMIKIIAGIGQAMRSGSYIAFLIRASGAEQMENGDWVTGRYYDHLLDIAREIPFQAAMRFQLPNSIGRNDLTRREWATTNKQVLVKSRELIVWRVLVVADELGHQKPRVKPTLEEIVLMCWNAVNMALEVNEVCRRAPRRVSCRPKLGPRPLR